MALTLSIAPAGSGIFLVEIWRSAVGLTGHAAVDEASQVVAEWINLLCDDLQWTEKGRAYLLLSETLHAIRDYLTVDEAADLAAQLPLISLKRKRADIQRVLTPFDGALVI